MLWVALVWTVCIADFKKKKKDGASSLCKGNEELPRTCSGTAHLCRQYAFCPHTPVPTCHVPVAAQGQGRVGRSTMKWAQDTEADAHLYGRFYMNLPEHRLPSSARGREWMYRTSGTGTIEALKPLIEKDNSKLLNSQQFFSVIRCHAFEINMQRGLSFIIIGYPKNLEEVND